MAPACAVAQAFDSVAARSGAEGSFELFVDAGFALLEVGLFHAVGERPGGALIVAHVSDDLAVDAKKGLGVVLVREAAREATARARELSERARLLAEEAEAERRAEEERRRREHIK